MLYEIEYRVEHYSLADCMRPNPFWGKRIFRIDTEKLGTENEAEIRKVATENPPERFKFHSMTLLPGSVKHGDKNLQADAVDKEASPSLLDARACPQPTEQAASTVPMPPAATQRGYDLSCQFCGGSDGHSEQVHTGDLESKGGWEDWFCCHPCRDAGQPCETFHRIPID